MKVLVVDDSKAMRLLVMRALRQIGLAGHTFEEASNGVEALKAILAAPPDLVLADWNMPEMNGLELLNNLRAQGSEVRFGFVTSESSAEMRDQALRAGALFLLTKPFTPETLQTALAPVLP